ncbi:MAG: FAD:protein FMN transferase [Mycetocola sp.]
MPQPEFRLAFEAIGTEWEISSSIPFTPELTTTISGICSDFDGHWSRFRSDSTISRLSATGGTATLPAESARLAELYRGLYRVTRGAVTPLIGRPLSRLGYSADYRLTPEGEPEPATEWSRALDWSGRDLTLAQGEILDVGAAGKGELVDQISAALQSAGHTHFVVDGSGDLRAVGLHDQPLRIALAKPGSPGLAIGTAELADGALCASATDRRRWSDELHHVLDGRTGAPTTEVAATWVVAETALIADAIATALFLAPAALLRDLAQFEYVRLFVNGQAETSPGFPGKVCA